jgi:hypothetical protein
MANISEHYTKEEGEGHTGKKGWINFLIEWYPVCVHDILVHLGKSVGFNVCRRLYLVVAHLLYLKGELVILAVVIRHP